jgi:hypothetical protein
MNARMMHEALCRKIVFFFFWFPKDFEVIFQNEFDKIEGV